MASSALFSGCNGSPYSREEREMAEEAAERALRSRYFRNFIIEETAFNEEVGRFEIFARSLDGEVEGRVNVYFEDGQMIVRRIRS